MILKDLKRARRVANKTGIFSLLTSVYEYKIRPLLPKTSIQEAAFNNITVSSPAVPILDSLIPIFPDRPNYESNFVTAIRRYVPSGAKTVAIGTGWGVSITAAARSLGSEGCLIGYEGARSAINRTRRTVQANDVGDRVDLHWAIVGSSVALWEGSDDASRISPEKLPDCEVLLIDCDGGEFAILEALDPDVLNPNLIIIEHHGIAGEMDYRPDEIVSLLDNGGYTISDQITSADPEAPRKDPRETVFVATDHIK